MRGGHGRGRLINWRPRGSSRSNRRFLSISLRIRHRPRCQALPSWASSVPIQYITHPSISHSKTVPSRSLNSSGLQTLPPLPSRLQGQRPDLKLAPQVRQAWLLLWIPSFS
ncbi:hypothetical protein MAPG_07519 [Magnaporthiopsis poae ATCC 64411]|uniref:Uncharacterized protein n=1 Tax=Magnaporthiopsis poae (strain ATCC 64411 / 73-15) TaxID=644358 RepID=A0A0C4E4W5_MAGP6|nr:hypothetical protein MAPG_07519 [Magnaporthiopsis poae ATCC 64411]